MKCPPLDSKTKEYIESVSASVSAHIQFVDLPTCQSEPSSESPQLAGFVVGMFYTTMIDMANEFGVPSYVFEASSAAAFSLML
uniref:Uncharacterized protein n=1 Tax=Populus trichocarpa TaxID=3694 RepID=A0A2K1ZUW0_POPTR